MPVMDSYKKTRRIHMVAIAKIIIPASGPITTPPPNLLDKNRHSKNLLGLGQIAIGSMTEYPHLKPKLI
jgi:hypothetical protein